MALVSGRPISFQMDLYSPLYVNRPTVVPELFQSLRPVAYSGSMEDDSRRMARKRDRAKQVEELARVQNRVSQQTKGLGGFAPSSGNEAYGNRVEKELKDNLDLGRSVSSAASAAKLGDFFQYAIDKPVTLPRQKTALLPIVGKEVQASRVSIYNERTQAKF